MVAISPTPSLSSPRADSQVITLDSLRVALARLNAKITVEDILAVIRTEEETKRTDLYKKHNPLAMPRLPADLLASKFPPVLAQSFPPPIDLRTESITPPPPDRDSPEFHAFRRRCLRKIIADMPKPWDIPSQPQYRFPPPVSGPNTEPIRTDDPLYQERRRRVVELRDQYLNGIPGLFNDFS